MINISKIYFQLAEKKEFNSDIEKEYKLKKNSLKRLTGINKRYISGQKETSEKLAIKACKNLKKKEIKNLSHIISITNTPSIKFPGISNFISSFLKKENVHCLNLNSGCTGYVDGLILAYEIIKNNKKSKILIITSDTYSKFIKKNNRNIRPLFSDGASASIIEYKKEGFKLKKKITINSNKSQNNLILNKTFIEMNGPALVSFAIKNVIPELAKTTKNANTAYVHQAGKVVSNIIKNNLKNLFIPTNYGKYGNLVSTSIPVLIKENFNRFKKDKKIVICGFGVGLSMSLIQLTK
ncbi:hypothetical protein OAL74_02160 [Candidatus Pelagibacter sp.]|nr:hypothetical protein [Candidatus Pelagibacter sp.]